MDIKIRGAAYLVVWITLGSMLVSACSPAATQSITASSPVAVAIDTAQPTQPSAPPTPTSTFQPTFTATLVPPTATQTQEPTSEATATIAATPHTDSILQAKSALYATEISFSSTGNEFLIFKDPKFEIRRADDGSLLSSFSAATRVTAFDISPDGTLIAVAVSSSDFISTDLEIYALASGERLSGIQTAHETVVQALKFSPDGTQIISGAHDKSVKVWNLADGSLADSFLAQTAEITCMAVSGSGQYIVTGSLGTDREVNVWTINGQKVTTIQKNINHCYQAMFSPDDQWLLTYSGEQMSLFRVSDWGRVWQMDYSQAVYPFAGFAPDSRLFLADRSGKLEWLNASSQEVTREYMLGSIAAFDFSPDGTEIVVARPNGVIEVFHTGLSPVNP